MEQNSYETAKKLKLDAMFTDLLTKSPTPDQLWQIVRLCEHLRDRAWKEFVKTNPDKQQLKRMMDDLCNTWVKAYPARRIIECFPESNILMKIIEDSDMPELTSEAAQAIVAHPQKDGLVFVLRKLNDPTICEQAGQVLLELSPTEDELVSIVNSKNTSISKKSAGDLLMLEKQLTDRSMSSIVFQLPALIPELWQKYKKTMSDFVLQAIIGLKAQPACRGEAARMLLDRSTSFSPLFYVFMDCPDLREEVWKKLSAIELSVAWLEAIMREGPEFTGRVVPLIAALKEKYRSDPRNAATVVYNNIMTAERASE